MISRKVANDAKLKIALFSNPRSRSVLVILQRKPARSVGEIQEILSLEQSQASQILAKLRKAGLVTVKTNGKYRIYSVVEAEIVRLENLIRQV